MRISINAKALGAFKKLGAVALITATIFFTACNQTGGGGGGKPTPTPTPKHAITFGVESGNGTLKAKADGVAETSTSPINVEQGKEVTFTATANVGYQVKGWTLDGKPIAEAGKSNTYIHTVTKPATITVSFEEIPKHKITFKVEGTHGWFKAMVGEVEITSGREIEEGKVITFTATPDATYRVKEWKVDDASIEGNKTNTYTHTVTKSANITVSFEEIPKHKITFKVEGKNGTLTAKVDGSKIFTGKDVVEGKTVTFTATADAGYGVKEWKVDDTALQDNKENTYTHTVTQASTIKVSFELLPPGEAILTLDPNRRYVEIRAETADGSDITVEGCTKTTLKSTYGTKKTTLIANGTTIVLKGYITELDCSDNHQLPALNVQGCTALKTLFCSNSQLTALNAQGCTALKTLLCSSNKLTSLNVQGCTALQELYCKGNKLNAQAMTELLNALPAREASDKGKALLYYEMADEGNCKDYSTPEDLKKAFDGAKSRNWELKKTSKSWIDVDI